VVFLILESLGSTELLFILVMALVFFGPRKLPQLSRTIGKSLSDFRRASDDFKSTWNREVNMEELNALANFDEPVNARSNSILDTQPSSQPLQAPSIQAVTPDRVIARERVSEMTSPSVEPTSDQESTEATSSNSHKHEWL
jgi:Tat protein translocase TatB subunit